MRFFRRKQKAPSNTVPDRLDDDMRELVDRLRIDYALTEEAMKMSPAKRVAHRRETEKLKAALIAEARGDDASVAPKRRRKP